MISTGQCSKVATLVGAVWFHWQRERSEQQAPTRARLMCRGSSMCLLPMQSLVFHITVQCFGASGKYGLVCMFLWVYKGSITIIAWASLARTWKQLVRVIRDALFGAPCPLCLGCLLTSCPCWGALSKFLSASVKLSTGASARILKRILAAFSNKDLEVPLSPLKPPSPKPQGPSTFAGSLQETPCCHCQRRWASQLPNT